MANESWRSIKVRKGTRFNSTYADGNPVWVVTKKAGKDTWEAVCQGEDFAGTVKAFFTEEIQRSIGFSKFWKEQGDENDVFYASLKEGQQIHYCNGFNQYIECVVVQKDGQNMLKPIAMKGDWPNWDIPHRMANGEVLSSYHADQIKNGKLMRPNFSCILEAPNNGYAKKVPLDVVVAMPRINLEVPPITERQTENQKISEILKSVSESIEGFNSDLRKDDGTLFLIGLKQNIASMLREAAKKLDD